MPHHIHLLITPAVDATTAKCLQLIKGGFSFAVRKQFQGDVWHTGYHEHRIRDLEDFDNQKPYIANNPIRKNYPDYPQVHTQYENRLDTIPSHLKIEQCS